MNTILDIPYGEINGRVLSLDAVQPERRCENGHPVALWLHGGGWRSGNKRNVIDGHMLDFLVDIGFVVASVEYRLSGEAQFPAQIHDVKAAIRWLRAYPQVLNIDVDCIAVTGFSAGGHLAALTATTADVPELEGECGSPGYSTKVKAAVVWGAPTDFTRNPAVSDPSLNAHIPPGEKTGEERLLGGPVEQNLELARLANPGRSVGPDTPPFLIIHGSRDEVVPISQAEYLYEVLESSGVEATFVRVEGGNHGCWPAGQPYPSKPGPVEIEQWISSFLEYYVLEKTGAYKSGWVDIEAPKI